jgi:hypothetical protein
MFSFNVLKWVVIVEQDNKEDLFPNELHPEVYLKTLSFLNLIPPSSNHIPILKLDDFLILKFHFPKNFMIQFQWKCIQYLLKYWKQEIPTNYNIPVDWMMDGVNGELMMELERDPLLFLSPISRELPLLKDWEEYFLIQQEEEETILLERIEFEKKMEIPSLFPLSTMRKDMRDYYPFEYLLGKQPHRLNDYAFKREENKDPEYTSYEEVIIPSLLEEEQELSMDSLSFLYHHVFHPKNELPSQLLNYTCVRMSVEIREKYPSLLYLLLKKKYTQWGEKKIILFKKEVSVLYFISMNMCSILLDILQKREWMLSLLPILMERDQTCATSLQVISLLQSMMKDMDMEMIQFLKKESMPESIWRDSMEYLLLEFTNGIFSHPWKEEKISWLEYSKVLMDMCNSMENGTKKYYILQVSLILKNVQQDGRRIKYHPIMNIHVLEELFHSISFKEYYYTLGELYLKYKE